MTSQKISVIIPVINEASTIGQTLTNLQNITNLEVIIVDGGSQDETVEIAKSLGVQVLFSLPGRARQMNAGAAAATGEILLFLHADTRLPEGFDTIIHQTLAAEGRSQNPIAGAFQLRIDASLKGLRLIEKLVNLRSRVFSLPYGDQAFFLKTAVFRDMGGFPDLPIMEDFELVRQLKRLGKIEIVPASVITSGRRWQKLGVVKTTLMNQWVIMAYFLGIPPAKIARWYRGK